MVVGLSSILRHRLTAGELKMAPAVVRGQEKEEKLGEQT